MKWGHVDCQGFAASLKDYSQCQPLGVAPLCSTGLALQPVVLASLHRSLRRCSKTEQNSQYLLRPELQASRTFTSTTCCWSNRVTGQAKFRGGKQIPPLHGQCCMFSNCYVIPGGLVIRICLSQAVTSAYTQLWS